MSELDPKRLDAAITAAFSIRENGSIDFDAAIETAIRTYLAATGAGGQAVAGRHVAYFDDGEFHWMSGIAPHNCELYAHPAPSGQAVATPTVNELFANCDRWGAVEWFNRLAMAIHNRDKAVVEGDDLSFATYDNIAKSSAARLVHDFEQEVRSALAHPVQPGWRPTHRHKKRGSEYMLVGFGKMQTASWREPVPNTTTGSVPVDLHSVAIYRGEDGKLWVRPREEFEDGRFEALPAAPQPKGE